MTLSKKITIAINTLLIFITVILLLFEVHLLVSAQEGASGDTSAPAAGEEQAFKLDEPSKCAEYLKQFIAQKQIEFGEFMNNHFRSGKPTSELIPSAVARFRQYREDVRKEMNELIKIESGKTATAVIPERAACENVMKEDFKIITELIRQHIAENAYAKKSTRLLDEYKELNRKLEKLNFTIAQMYGYFGALSQKLPCYATDCVR